MNGWLYSHLTNLPTADQMNVFTKESGIANPSETPLFTDGVWLDCWPRPEDRPAEDLYIGYVGHGNNMGRVTIPRHGGFVTRRAPRNFDTSQRLPGAVNACCYDGRVETVKLEALWNLCWNKNWAPPAARPR